MEEALRYLRGLGGTPLIAFIGHPCRSWYADEGVAGAVMEILRDERMYQLVHSKPMGFDFMIHRLAGYIGLACIEFAPGDVVEGRPLRDPGMLDGVAMAVIFPVEKDWDVDRFGHVVSKPSKKEDWRTADPTLVEMIEELGLPILVVHRTGETLWFPDGDRDE